MFWTIDEELIDLFKSIVAENAQTYERRCVAPIGRKFADEIKATPRDRTLESRLDARNAWRERRYKHERRGYS
jgi:hypothetical protein